MATLELNRLILIALAIVSGLGPALFWLWFWLKEDRRQPEPSKMIVRVFILGGLSVALASIIERALVSPADLIGPTAAVWPAVLILALVEESLKLIMVYLGAFRSPYFDEPVDAMIYMITAALGFAAVENILFMLGAQGGLRTMNLDFLLTGNFRFIGATIVHVVSSALIGGFLGLAFYRRRLGRVAWGALGLATAVALHALFNFFIIKSDSSGILQVFVGLWLAAIFIIYFFERVKKNIIRSKLAP